MIIYTLLVTFYHWENNDYAGHESYVYSSDTMQKCMDKMYQILLEKGPFGDSWYNEPYEAWEEALKSETYKKYKDTFDRYFTVEKCKYEEIEEIEGDTTIYFGECYGKIDTTEKLVFNTNPPQKNLADNKLFIELITDVMCVLEEGRMYTDDNCVSYSIDTFNTEDTEGSGPRGKHFSDKFIINKT